jgi:hypothetical protein
MAFSTFYDFPFSMGSALLLVIERYRITARISTNFRLGLISGKVTFIKNNYVKALKRAEKLTKYMIHENICTKYGQLLGRYEILAKFLLFLRRILRAGLTARVFFSRKNENISASVKVIEIREIS